MTGKTKAELTEDFKAHPNRDLTEKKITNLLDSLHVRGSTSENTNTEIALPDVNFNNVGHHGCIKGVWQPDSTDTENGADVNAVKTPLLMHQVVDASIAPVGGVGHALAVLGLLETIGDKAIGQSFGIESRLEHNNTAGMGEYAFFKAVLGAVASNISTIYGLDIPDMSALLPNANRYGVNVRDPQALSLFNGGIATDTIQVGVTSYQLKPSDSGKTIGVFAGAPCSIIFPSSMPKGRRGRIKALDANDVDLDSDGSAVILEADSQFKVAGIYKEVFWETTATGVYIITGDTKA